LSTTSTAGLAAGGGADAKPGEAALGRFGLGPRALRRGLLVLPLWLRLPGAEQQIEKRARALLRRCRGDG
jgi:hypothetical protein